MNQLADVFFRIMDMDNMRASDDLADTELNQNVEGSSNRIRFISYSVLGLIGLFFFVAIIWPNSASSTNIKSNDIGKSVFLLKDNSESSLNDKLDKPLVVNFYASTCAPCKAELPDFENVHLQVKDEVTFIGLNQDISEQTWRAFDEETAITFETGFQPFKETFNALNGNGLPMTVLIDTDGEIKQKFSGVLDDAALKIMINNHFGVEFDG